MFLLGALQRGLVLLSPVDLQQLFTPPYLTPNLPSILCQPSFTFHHVVKDFRFIPRTHFFLFT